MEQGKVWLVGAGPGDAELLTRKAVRVLQEADVIVYDALVGQAILAELPRTRSMWESVLPIMPCHRRRSAGVLSGLQSRGRM